MSKILVSGLVNVETNTKIQNFPINYCPINYSFFGVESNVSGVAYNISKALTTLGDDVSICSMTGKDFNAEYIIKELKELGISGKNVLPSLKATPASVILYDEQGKRQIYCDLKDIQETEYDFTPDMYRDADIVVACNINFNRPLLRAAHNAGKTIATDVHVLRDINDEYNKDFMQYSNILFLSDEGIEGEYVDFIKEIADKYHNEIIVIGMGNKGAMMYVREEDRIYEMPAVSKGKVVNTVGAGDALFSAFICLYARGYDPEACLMYAQRFAALKICHNGAAQGFCSFEELLNSI
jgi:ribokinase